MESYPRTIALILARGGSKGIPRKNIQVVGGKPLIAWTIEAARASRWVQRVILSTDDEEIAEIARAFGCEVPFLRPAELAQDDSTSFEACAHALRYLEKEGECPDYLVILQPTSPLRLAADIDGAVELISTRRAPALMGVCEATPHPYLARRILEDGTLRDFYSAPETEKRRQEHPPAYYVNGAVYVVEPATLLATGTFQPPGTLAFPMPPERSLDIDTLWDLSLADVILTRGTAPSKSNQT